MYRWCLYFRDRSTNRDKEQYENEQKEKWRAKFGSFTKFLFNRSGSDDAIGRRSSCDKDSHEGTNRRRSQSICQDWIKTTQYRFEIIAHLDDIGCQRNKNWFLLNDKTTRTDRLMSLVPIPSDCIALEKVSSMAECPKTVLMELLASLQHPYIYPVLDLGFFYTNQTHYVCPIMPLNSRGSLKDLIYKVRSRTFGIPQQWNIVLNFSLNGTSRGIKNIHRSRRMCQYHRYSGSVVKYLKHFYFWESMAFRLMDTYTVETLFYKMVWPGKIFCSIWLTFLGLKWLFTYFFQNKIRVSGLENGLLGLKSHVNAVTWSRNVIKLEYMDIICFAHLLFEMCTGKELKIPLPTTDFIHVQLSQYPQVTYIHFATTRILKCATHNSNFFFCWS